MRTFMGLFVLSFCLIATGCGGDETATVRGKVTLDNNPIEMGSIVMVTEDGKRTGMGTIGPDGTYTVPNAPIGNVKISLAMPPTLEEPNMPDDIKDDPKMKDDARKSVKGELPKELKSAGKVARVPRGYMDAVKSPLRLTVKDGENQHDIKLSSEGSGDDTVDPKLPPMPPLPPGLPE